MVLILKQTQYSVQARDEVLEQAKSLIERNDHHSSLHLLSRDICSLLDRELEMLAATELSGEFLVGLRNRMLNLFAKLVTESNDRKVIKTKSAIKK